MSNRPITALVYADSDRADRVLREIALNLLERGFHLAGLFQRNQPRPGRSRCDMVLEELSTGSLVAISQDRGPLARGCALDIGQLLQAMELVRNQIAAGPDLVILNKFGKTEAEGGGFRDIIAEVVDRGLPLLIAVPWRNIESWRLFVGDLSREMMVEEALNDVDAFAAETIARRRLVSPANREMVSISVTAVEATKLLGIEHREGHGSDEARDGAGGDTALGSP